MSQLSPRCLMHVESTRERKGKGKCEEKVTCDFSTCPALSSSQRLVCLLPVISEFLNPGNPAVAATTRAKPFASSAALPHLAQGESNTQGRVPLSPDTTYCLISQRLKPGLF